MYICINICTHICIVLCCAVCKGSEHVGAGVPSNQRGGSGRGYEMRHIALSWRASRRQR